MCAIFGVLDYRGKISSAFRLSMVRELGKAAEVRGTDATGIAFFAGGKLHIQKAPRPAHRMTYRIPAEVRYIMGHTRMTTQGTPERNQNNHPFAGRAGKQRFALAHNGVIYNDNLLRQKENLPVTSIETDSYVAAQLIEKQGEVSFASLRTMAEMLEGNFTFTVLEQGNDLYFIRGDNPLVIFHYPRMGLYLYASTGGILSAAAKALGIEGARSDVIQPRQGDILRIDRKGRCEWSTFDDTNLTAGCYDPFSLLRRGWPVIERPWENGYLAELKAVAWSYGYAPEMIDRLIARGFEPEEIEEFLVEGYYDYYEQEEAENAR